MRALGAAGVVVATPGWAQVPTTDAGPPASLALDALRVLGPRPGPMTEAYARVVRAQLAHLRACREHGAGVDPGLAGVLAVQLALDVGGRVTVVTFGGFGEARALAHCVEPHLRRMQFPPGRGQALRLGLSLVVNPQGAPLGRGPAVALPPSMNAPPPTAPPALGREALRTVVRAHRSETDRCHQLGLATNPSLGGRAVVRFTVGADGAVTSAEVAEAPEPLRAVAECVASAVQRWTFPPPSGAASATFTWNFDF